MRNCTEEETNICEDKLCDTMPCFAVCMAKGEKYSCMCDKEESYFDTITSKCRANDDACSEDEDCGADQVCLTTQFGAFNVTRCECMEGLLWNTQSEMCDTPCGGNMRKPDGDKPSKPQMKPHLCDVNATCTDMEISLPDGNTTMISKCQCNDGFFGAGVLGTCANVAEDCDNACKDKYSQDHVCLAGEDGSAFSCVCQDGMIAHGDDSRQCVADTTCETSEDCFYPYIDYGMLSITINNLFGNIL